MKAVTLTQPWALLVVLGKKQIETRGFRPRSLAPGHWLLIHAARTMTDAARRLLAVDPEFRRALQVCRPGGVDLVHGSIIGAVRYQESLSTETIMGTVTHRGLGEDLSPSLSRRGWPLPLTSTELAFGNYDANRYGWLLADAKRLTQPVPCRGHLAIWDVPEFEGGRYIRSEVVQAFKGSGLTLEP